MAFNILFFGSDTFSSRVFQTLFQKPNNHTFYAIFPPPKNPQRKTTDANSEFEQFLSQHFPQIPKSYAPNHYSEKSLKNWEIPKKFLNNFDRFDIAIVASFGYFIPPKIIDHFSTTALNVHPSLLPAYRGSSPIQHSLLNNDISSGVSIQTLSPKNFDLGDILLSKEFSIQDDTFSTLLKKSASIGGDLLDLCLNDLDYYLQHSVVQDINDPKATSAPKLSDSDHFLQNWDIDNVYGRFRAFEKIKCYFQDQVITLRDCQPFTILEIEERLNILNNQISQLQPGRLFITGTKKSPETWIKCNGSYALKVEQFQLENKTQTSSLDFINGFRLRDNHIENTLSCEKEAVFDIA